MRVFWQGMESMSQYWDCTLDQYYAVDQAEGNGEKSPKRQKLDVADEDGGHDESGPGVQETLTVPAADEKSIENAEVKRSSEESVASSFNDTVVGVPADGSSTSRSTMRYKGFRTNSGRYMPDQFRFETVKGFVEGTVWPFQCNVYPPRMMPLVHFGKLKIPVRQSVAVYRLPKDRTRARAGGLVGPVLGVQVRPEIDFSEDADKDRLDVMREIGGLLQLAQERAREGKQEVKPGEGKWWTTVPRWGGGPGGEVENTEGNSDIVEIATELLAATKGVSGSGGKDTSSKRQRKTPAVLWKELKCGSGYFDPKTDYAAIGKDPASDVDEVSITFHMSTRIASFAADSCLLPDLPRLRPQSPHFHPQAHRPSRLHRVSTLRDNFTTTTAESQLVQTNVATIEMV